MPQGGGHRAIGFDGSTRRIAQQRLDTGRHLLLAFLVARLRGRVVRRELDAHGEELVVDLLGGGPWSEVGRATDQRQVEVGVGTEEPQDPELDVGRIEDRQIPRPEPAPAALHPRREERSGEWRDRGGEDLADVAACVQRELRIGDGVERPQRHGRHV
jgi:hypothetical protein